MWITGLWYDDYSERGGREVRLKRKLESEKYRKLLLEYTGKKLQINE
jgi:hypothetical protein